MKETRTMVRLGHAGGYHAGDGADLAARLRRVLTAQPDFWIANVRVTSRAIEFDLFGPSDPPAGMLSGLQGAIGPLLTVKRLEDLAGKPPAPEPIVAEARRLFNEERFWEVHEVLEGLWKSRVDPEKKWVQGLILIAAALVHLQRNESHVAPRMLEDGLRRLEGAPDSYHGWNLRAFREAIRLMNSRPAAPFPTV